MSRYRPSNTSTVIPELITPFKLADVYDHAGIILSMDDVPGMDTLSLHSGLGKIIKKQLGDLDNSKKVESDTNSRFSIWRHF
jgi:hypothetical protein